MNALLTWDAAKSNFERITLENNTEYSVFYTAFPKTPRKPNNLKFNDTLHLAFSIHVLLTDRRSKAYK